MHSQGLCRPSQGKRESPDIWANVKVEVSEDNTLLRQNSNLNLSEIHEPERCLVNAERKCRDCGPAVQRSLWGIEIWSGHHLYITQLYFCVLLLLEIYDQCRGPSIKEKDHLVG